MKFTSAKDRSIQLVDRDLAILQLIRSRGAKTSSELSDRFWEGKSKKAKAGFQRIRMLIEAGYLERGNPQLLYVTDSAKQLLSKLSGVEGGSLNERTASQ